VFPEGTLDQDAARSEEGTHIGWVPQNIQTLLACECNHRGWSLENCTHVGGIAECIKVFLAGELNHRRWAAHEDDGLLVRRRQTVLDHVCGDEASLLRQQIV